MKHSDVMQFPSTAGARQRVLDAAEERRMKRQVLRAIEAGYKPWRKSRALPPSLKRIQPC